VPGVPTDRPSLRRLAFHPITVLAVSLAVAGLYAGWMVWRSGGQDQRFFLFYCVPIVVPFVAFLFDRAERIAEMNLVRWAADVVVLALSLARFKGMGGLPVIAVISGHALFLTHALLTARSWVVRVTAAIVMLQVIYVKLPAGDLSLYGGILVGCLTAAVHHFLKSRRPVDSPV